MMTTSKKLNKTGLLFKKFFDFSVEEHIRNLKLFLKVPTPILEDVLGMDRVDNLGKELLLWVDFKSKWLKTDEEALVVFHRFISNAEEELKLILEFTNHDTRQMIKARLKQFSIEVVQKMIIDEKKYISLEELEKHKL